MNLKRFGALVGVILIVGVYVTTLVLALIGSPQTANMLKASFFLTFFIPIMAYAFVLMDKFLRKDKPE